MTTFRCRVILLDDTVIERDLEKKAVGQVLFDQVCEYLNLLERDYFGLELRDSSNNKVWLDLSKEVHKQIISHDATFTFFVKFYPPDPSALAEDITRYLLCLQLRTDILSSSLSCPSDKLAVLGSYMIQSEFGDYNPELHGKEFYSKIPLAPNQTPELEEKVTELHRTLKSMSPAQADQRFLQNVNKLDMYGVHLHPAKDASGGDVMLGVCADGLVVYKDEKETQSFIWPTVVKMSYIRSNFHAKILRSEDASENTIKFILPSYRACKCLWRDAVEHHAFFRNLRNPEKAPKWLLNVGSRFRFHGLTHAESQDASATIKRPAPRFSRLAIKRKAKESLLVALKRPNRTEFDDWFQVLGSEESWPTYDPDKDKPSGGESLPYKEREEVEKLDNEWSQLFGGRSIPAQYSLSSLSSDTDILESASFQLWKMKADDWFVLLEPRTYQPTFWSLKTRPLSLQSSQAEEQREELEWIERTSGKSIEVVKLRKEVESVTEQHEELKMERNFMRSDIVGENLELDIGASDQILKVMREKIERGGDGEEIQTVVIYEQRTQEVEPYTGQSQEVFVEQRMRGTEEVEVDTVHEMMLKTGQVVSEENIEELEETLLEVESIEQRLQDIERLKVRLQEVEILEQMLQQAGKRQEEIDDWYILLEHRLIESSAPKRLLGVKTSEKKLQDTEQKRQERGERGDWYLLLDRKPLVASSASTAMDTTEQKAEIRQWIEEELQRANTLTPVQMKDDWYVLLELLPRYAQTMQPALPPSGPVTLISEDVASLRPQQTVTIKEKEETMIIKEKQVIAGGVEKKIPASMREDEDNWFVHFTPAQLEEKGIATAGVSDAWILEEKRLREMQKTQLREDVKRSHVVEDRRLHPYLPGPKAEEHHRVHHRPDDWFIQLEPKKSAETDIQSSWVHVIEEHKNLGEEMKWQEERAFHVKEAQPTLPTQREEQTQKQVEDYWFIQQDVSPKKAELATDVDFYKKIREEEVKLLKKEVQKIFTIKEKEVTFDEKPMIFEEMQVIGGVKKKLPATMHGDEDNWFVLFTPAQIEKKGIATVPVTLISEDVASLRPQQTVTIKEKEETMIIKEKQVIAGGVEKKIPASMREDEDNWFVHFTPAQLEEKGIATAGVSDAWILEEKRLREMQKTHLREDVKRSHMVEDRRLHPYLPGPKAEERHRVHHRPDDWFIQLEPKKSVSVDKRAEEDWRRKEEVFKKQAMAEERRKVAGFKPRSVPVIPLTPSDQPMTSTPTAQYVRVTRPTYQEESLQRIDLTQEITQDIKQESKVETESIVMRKRREKRIERESIYIRHSILMLEDSDVIQEELLRHHASISKLKQFFMEDMPVYGPTEWDKRLSTYTPVVFPKLSNGELLLA